MKKIWARTEAAPPYTENGQPLYPDLDGRIALLDGQRVRLCGVGPDLLPAPMANGMPLCITDAPSSDDTDPVLLLHTDYRERWAMWTIWDLRGM